MESNWRRRGSALVAFAVAMATAQPAAAQWRTDFSKHTVPLEEIVPGGPPKDGIPAIDEPSFVDVEDADDWLSDREPVMVVTHEGRAKAYPLQILIYHEIVNDEIGDLPISVTFCPLCNTGIVFDRRHDGRVLDFGTTGRLRHSDLVMYDRQTESWWQQATAEAIVGALAGDTLRWIPAQMISWKEFRSAYPDGRVLSRDTGYDRPYGQNPYAGYDDPDSGPFGNFFSRRPDDRLPPKERVATVRIDDETAAYPFSRLESARVANDEVGGVPIVVFWAPGTASALDDAQIRRGRDVGASGVFRRTVDGRTLTFESADASRFRDRETGSTWDIVGRAVAGPLQGTELTPVVHGVYFWFAWGVFQPDTRIWRP